MKLYKVDVQDLLIEIMYEATRTAQVGEGQVIGFRNDYYITLYQLEQILQAITN